MKVMTKADVGRLLAESKAFAKKLDPVTADATRDTRAHFRRGADTHLHTVAAAAEERGMTAKWQTPQEMLDRLAFAQSVQPLADLWMGVALALKATASGAKSDAW